MSLGVICDSIREIKVISIDSLYYFLFFAMMVMYFVANRKCNVYDNTIVQEQDEPGENKSLKERFCENRDALTLNVGVMFLCMVAFRSYYKRYINKLEK